VFIVFPIIIYDFPNLNVSSKHGVNLRKNCGLVGAFMFNISLKGKGGLIKYINSATKNFWSADLVYCCALYLIFSEQLNSFSHQSTISLGHRMCDAVSYICINSVKYYISLSGICLLNFL